MSILLNKRILLALGMIVFVGAIVAGGTGAFFSDTETSSNNTFAAGAIDLGIDNESYYNGVKNDDTSWAVSYDLDDGGGPATGGAYLFFDFKDLKPGDWGEDTIGVTVKDNNAYACAYVKLTEDAENTITEPEEDLGDTNAEGELDDNLHFVWWADDGDNVLEADENVINEGMLGDAPVGTEFTVALADSQQNVWDGTGPLTGSATYHIGKAWCFGDLTKTPVAAGTGTSPADDPGITCNGALVTNDSQTDSAKLDVWFTAVQSRNNDSFVCSAPVVNPTVGANFARYQAPASCDVTVSGTESIQIAVDGLTLGGTVCVDDSYNGSGDSAAVRIENANVTLAANVQGVDLFYPVVLSADGVTVTGFDGVIGQAESPSEVTAFYLDNDATNATVSYNNVVGNSTGAAVLTETGATLGGGLIAHNVLSNATQGMYLNPHTGVVIVENNDIDNNDAGIGGFTGAIVRFNEFDGNSEAIGADSSYDGTSTISANNFLTATDTVIKYGVYPAFDPNPPAVLAENNYWATGGANQTSGAVDFTPEAPSQFPHN